MVGLTVLDRRIPVQLHRADETASRRDSISADTERLHRLHGTSIVQQACRILSAPNDNQNNGSHDDWALVDATACILLHRFLHAVSLRDMDVWSVAMASTLLAAKQHDVPLTVRALILAYIHIYRQRTLLAVIRHGHKGDPDEMAATLLQRYGHVLAASPSVSALSWATRRTMLQHDVPAVSTAGPVWKEWHDAVVRTEQAILRQLGFVLYWIPESHPHWFAAPLVQALVERSRSNLDAQGNDATAATSSTAISSSVVETQLIHDTLRYCQLSSRLDLCLRLEPMVICCAAMHCALFQLATTETTIAQEKHGTKLPLAAQSLSTGVNENDNDTWWMVFCSNVQSTTAESSRQRLAQDLSNAINALLGLEDDTNLDVVVANHAYVTSNVNGGSFVDPTSFVWEMLVDRPSTTASNSSTTNEPS
jgi:cyclin L